MWRVSSGVFMWRVSCGAFHLVFSVRTVDKMPFLQNCLQSAVLTTLFTVIHLKPKKFTAIHFVIGHFESWNFRVESLAPSHFSCVYS